MIEKHELLTREKWGTQEHIDGLVSIKDVRSAYLWAIKEIGEPCFVKEYIKIQAVLDILKKAFEAVADEEKGDE